MEKEYFDTLMSSLEDAAAFAQGDESRARVVEVETSSLAPESKAKFVTLVRELKPRPQTVKVRGISVVSGDKVKCVATLARGTKSLARGGKVKGVPKYKAEDVVQLRKRLNLNRHELATVLGVSPEAVHAWESGKGVPSGAARHLLFLLDKDHSLVQRLVAK